MGIRNSVSFPKELASHFLFPSVTRREITPSKRNQKPYFFERQVHYVETDDRTITTFSFVLFLLLVHSQKQVNCATLKVEELVR